MTARARRFLKLKALICDISLLADEGKLRHGDGPSSTFDAISEDAERARSLIVQLQKETA